MKRLFNIFIGIALPVLACSQVSTFDLQAMLSSPEHMKEAGIFRVKQVQQFYSYTGYKAIWLTEEGQSNYKELLELIRNARLRGLEPCDYARAFSNENFCSQVTMKADSVIMEMRITDAAMHLYADLVNGNSAPDFSYDGLSYDPPEEFIPLQLFGALRSGTLSALANSFTNSMPQVKAIVEEIGVYTSRMQLEDFVEEKIISNKVNSQNRPLCWKLFALGCTDSLLISAPDSLVGKAVKKAQEKFDLLNDGVLRSTALEALNITLAERLERLSQSVNYYRWLHTLTQWQPVIVVNIPAAHLKVFHKAETIMQMRLIVGKPSTPTPLLTSRVSEVILYPYWVVPSSIIFNEMLPVLRRNPGYINANNYQVLDRQGKIVDPLKIDWSSLSASHFPYIIRQSTGCDNALGILKLNFYNPYTVYLHDTPSKSLFMTKKRFYSHGCMRMEKPIDLGHLVLGNNGIAIDTLEEKGCLRNQKPIVVPAENKLAVVVWYNLTDINNKGQIVFYEDIYKKFRRNSIVKAN